MLVENKISLKCNLKLQSDDSSLIGGFDLLGLVGGFIQIQPVNQIFCVKLSNYLAYEKHHPLIRG